MEIDNVEYDNWKLQEDDRSKKVYGHCDQCKGEIYSGEEYWETIYDSYYAIHEDCFKDFVINHFGFCLRSAE